MSTKYAQFIKALRKERGLSQLELAKKLGMSRPSYIAVEQGKRELTLSEAENLSAILGVSLKEMESGISANYEKYKQMILAYLRNAGSKKDGKITKTKLAKLLYLADFAWFYNHLKSMSGMQYRKILYGPVPDSYFRAVDELFEDGKIEITPTEDGAMLISQTRNGAKTILSEINKEEEKLIKDISGEWRDGKTKEIVAFTHNQLPYVICSDNEIIPYELITQEDPEHVY
ncbi:MAG: helix-turn-helix domain-containing protein [Patescibacteria group bacterium]